MYEVLGEVSISEQSRLSIASFSRGNQASRTSGWISSDGFPRMSRFLPQEANASSSKYGRRTVGRFRQNHLWPTALLGITGFLTTRDGFAKIFTSVGRHLGCRYGSRVGYNTWIHPRRQLEASILLACFSRNLSAFVSPLSMVLKLIANPTNALCWLADAPILETFIHAVSYTRVESLPFPTGGHFVVEPQGLFHLNPGPLLALTLFHANSFLSGMPVD